MTATLHALPSPPAAATPAEKTARILTGLGYQPGDMGYVFGDGSGTASALARRWPCRTPRS